MTDSIEIIPTVVPKDAGDFADAVSIVKKFTDRIHLDIDDGVFAPHPTWPFLPSGEFMPFNLSSVGVGVEAHLMVKNAKETGETLAGAGAAMIVGHVEAFASPVDARAALQSWRDSGAQAGIAVLMNTPLEAVDPLLDLCDVVQLMSIDTIGAQGAPFDRQVIPRIGQLHTRHPQVCIAVDGGVTASNIGDLARVGARRFLVGTAIMKQPDPTYAYNTLIATVQSALR